MNDVSGKFVLRVTPELHRRLKEASARKKLSLNQFCAHQLSLAVAQASQSESHLVHGLPVVLLRRWVKEASLPCLGCLVFGSVSRGEATASSDVDLLLVLPQDHEPNRDLYDVWENKVQPNLRASTSREVSPQFVSLPKELSHAGGIWFEAALEGQLLWEESREVTSLLVRLREEMASGKIVRHLSHGHPFWVRKETNEK